MGEAETSHHPRGALSGRSVHGCVLGGLLGQGASAEVYTAVPANGEPLAVKAIRVRPGQAELIRREIEALRSAQHPNILRYLWHAQGAGDLDGYVFLATERCVMSMKGALAGLPAGPERTEAAWAIVPRLVNDVLGGLSHLHGLQPGVIHRDIKPDNLLLSPSGVWRVADLGIAKVLEPAQNVAVDPTVAFTPGFTAPDLVRHREITAAVDIFGLGASVQWAFTGEQPWPPLPIHQFLGHFERHPPRLSPAVPFEWQPFVRAALEIDPRVRLGWSYPALIGWQPGDVPSGRPTIDASQARTTVLGAGTTLVAPPEPPVPVAAGPTVRTAVLRGVLTFALVFVALIVVIAIRRP